jgi:hypothetical protein
MEVQKAAGGGGGGGAPANWGGGGGGKTNGGGREGEEERADGRLSRVKKSHSAGLRAYHSYERAGPGATRRAPLADRG